MGVLFTNLANYVAPEITLNSPGEITTAPEAEPKAKMVAGNTEVGIETKHLARFVGKNGSVVHLASMVIALE